MGLCAFCEREMDEAASCTKNVILHSAPELDDGGDWRFAIPYGHEGRGIVKDQPMDKGDPGRRLPSGQTGRVKDQPMDKGDRCHDCGVSVEGFHHPGCDVEESPFNGEQLLGAMLEPDSNDLYYARAQADPHQHVELEARSREN